MPERVSMASEEASRTVRIPFLGDQVSEVLKHIAALERIEYQGRHVSTCKSFGALVNQHICIFI